MLHVHKWVGVAGLFGSMLLFGGCGTIGQKTVGWKGLSAGARVTVLPFRDHTSSDPEDRDNTGLISQEIVANAIRSEHSAVVVDPHVPAGFDSTVGYSLDQAREIGATRSADYVMFGQCIEFFRVAPMTFRSDKGGIAVTMISMPGGEVVYTLRHVQAVGNFFTPETAIEQIAHAMAEELHTDD